MKRLICFLFGHRPGRGLSARWCIYYWCERCHDRVPGGFASRD